LKKVFEGKTWEGILLGLAAALFIYLAYTGVKVKSDLIAVPSFIIGMLLFVLAAWRLEKAKK